jgi:membrane protein
MKVTALGTALVLGVTKTVGKPDMQKANARSYGWFVLSVAAALISLLTLAAYFPFSVLARTVAWIGRFLPQGAAGSIRGEFAAVVALHKGTILSLGILAFLWAASSGFSAMMEAMDMAYDVGDDRSFWMTRFIAGVLIFLTGGLLLVAFGVTLAGPGFGESLASRVNVPTSLVLVWPYLRWSAAVGLALVAVGALYLLGPNVKPRLSLVLPGLMVGVGCWLGMAYLLEISIRYFVTLNRTLEIIGVIVAIMLWLYWAGFALLMGAQVTAELARVSNEAMVSQTHNESKIIKLNLAA